MEPSGLDLSHPRLDGELEVALPLLTPVVLAPTFSLPPLLLANVASELSARATHDLPYLDRTYGPVTRRLIQGLGSAAHAPEDLDIVRLIAQAMRETLQSTGPTRTILGQVITDHAARMVNDRQGFHQFHIDEPRSGDSTNSRRASQLAAELPWYARSVGLILEQSAAALRQRAAAKGVAVLRMFRGVHGPASPLSVEDASGVRYAMRPLASWSMSYGAAEDFAEKRPEGCVLEAEVPVGCLALAPGYGEEEVMMFPIDPKLDIRVDDLHEIRIVDVHKVG